MPLRYNTGAPVQTLLGFAAVKDGVDPALHHLEESAGDMDPGAVVAATAFDQHDAMVRIAAQGFSQHTSG